MQRDSIRVKSEREEWRQRFVSLKTRAELNDSSRPLTYHRDGLATIHNADFLQDERFRTAYGAGLRAAGEDYQWEWRVRVGLWAAEHARALPGDFVECGVQIGFLSHAIMEALDWRGVDKTFYLLEADPEAGANVTAYPNVRLIRGDIPGAMDEVNVSEIAYLSLDLNSPEPEMAAGERFWPHLVPGAILLLNDYAYAGHEPQKRAWDGFAERHATGILPLPTGQGILIKRG